MASDAEKAWAAGLFEGEGTVAIPRRTGTYFQISISSTDFDVLSRFHGIVGCGTVRPQKLQPSNVKPYWMWQVGGLPAAWLLEDFMPWLGVRRQERAKEALSRYELAVA